MTYKLIQECGLPMQSRYGETKFYVDANDLEAFLASGVRVYGCSETSVNKEFLAGDSHSGILINYKPIPKLEPVSKEEIIETIQNAGVMMDEAINKVIERIKTAGVKP